MKTKKEFRYFTIFNHQKEEEYLRENHKHGWKFVRVSGLGVYHFEECEPQDVVYQLDYNPQPKEKQEDYLRMFADCGWEYLQEYVGYTYFRKPAAEMDGDEGIFNDDQSRADMMGRVYKGHLLPCLAILCACMIPQCIINLTLKNYGVAALLGGIILLYVALLATCAVSYYRQKNK